MASKVSNLQEISLKMINTRHAIRRKVWVSNFGGQNDALNALKSSEGLSLEATGVRKRLALIMNTKLEQSSIERASSFFGFAAVINRSRAFSHTLLGRIPANLSTSNRVKIVDANKSCFWLNLNESALIRQPIVSARAAYSPYSPYSAYCPAYPAVRPGEY